MPMRFKKFQESTSVQIMRRTGCLAFVIILTASAVLAQRAINLSYKGRLTDPDGTPITTATPAQFTVCLGGDPAAMGSCGGGTVAYEESITVNPDADGVFNHLIGTGTHMPPDLDLVLFNTTQPLFLEVAITGQMLLPRKLLVVNQDSAASVSFSLESIATAGTRGVIGATDSGVGVLGSATATSGRTTGVFGETRSSTDFSVGVAGFASATSGGVFGVRGDVRSSGPFALGVYGLSSATTGNGTGVRGDSAASNGGGVYGFAGATSGSTTGVRGDARSPNGSGGLFLNSGGGDPIQGWGNSGLVFRVANNGDVFTRGRRITGNSVAVCTGLSGCGCANQIVGTRDPCTVTSDTGACSQQQPGWCCVCIP